LECGPISRWDISDFLFGCTNSMGSSMVTKCIARVEFISLMIAESVVLLPDPVGPVTSTSPERRCTILRIDSGSPSCATVISFVGMMRSTAESPRSCRKRFTRKRETPGTS
jgi:hypothetical protein